MKQDALAKILDLEKWQTLQDSLAKVTQFAIIMVDYKGQPLTRHSDIHPFCREVRKDPKLNHFCQKCDARGGIEATRLEEPYIYRCHFNILDMAIPIIFDGNYVGALLAGQVKLSKGQMDLEQLVTIPHDLKESVLLRLQKEYQALPVITPEKTKEVAELLFQLSSYIVGEAIKKDYLVKGQQGKIFISGKENLSHQELNHLAKDLQQSAREEIFEHSFHQFYQAQNLQLQKAFDLLFEKKEILYSLEEAAQAAQLSPSYFSKCFKEETGESFLAFYRALKIFWAKEWLKNTDMTVTEIADRLGYQDSSYFIKVFKKETNTTPLLYRKKEKSVK